MKKKKLIVGLLMLSMLFTAPNFTNEAQASAGCNHVWNIYANSYPSYSWHEVYGGTCTLTTYYTRVAKICKLCSSSTVTNSVSKNHSSSYCN